MTEENEEEIEIIVTEPPVRVNDVVKHSTLGRFAVIGSSPQKVVCQSDQGKIYSLAMSHLTLLGFCFDKKTDLANAKASGVRIWKHQIQ